VKLNRCDWSRKLPYLQYWRMLDWRRPRHRGLHVQGVFVLSTQIKSMSLCLAVALERIE